MSTMKAWIFAAGVGSLVLAGCQTAQPLYYWGDYEPLTYATFAKPDKASPESQVAQLEENLQKSAAQNRQVGPGFHAYLGYLYLQLGKTDAAAQQFQTEKALFPESGQLMDRMLTKLKGKGAA